jgi:hypothetical protein
LKFSKTFHPNGGGAAETFGCQRRRLENLKFFRPISGGGCIFWTKSAAAKPHGLHLYFHHLENEKFLQNIFHRQQLPLSVLRLLKLSFLIQIHT